MLPIVLAALASGLSLATVSIGKVDCPQKFEGKVEGILQEVGPSSAYSTQKVIFKNVKTLKGNVDEQVQVDLLKHGPVQVKEGESYQVQVRNGRLCWIEKI